MIYLDNAATTPPLAQLNQLYETYAADGWQNPSALYAPAARAMELEKRAAQTLLAQFGAAGHKCFFTSGGTEGANTVILGGARRKKGMNFVCGGAEHPCVEEAFKLLEAQGHPVAYVKPDGHGVLRAADVAAAVDGDTALVSVMHVNNETGAKNDAAAIAAAVKAKNPDAMFHADGVQAFLREAADSGNIDYYTVSAHKVHALKGTGAVFYKPGAPLKPLLVGGGQEGGLRSGTQNTLGIFAFAEAAEYFARRKEESAAALWALRRAFLAACEGIADMAVISPGEADACAHIVNVSFPGAAGETLLHALEAEEIYISTGSACSSKKGKTRIARALGLADEVAAGAVRVSFSVFNTEDEVTRAAEAIKKNVALLRRFTRK